MHGHPVQHARPRRHVDGKIVDPAVGVHPGTSAGAGLRAGGPRAIHRERRFRAPSAACPYLLCGEPGRVGRGDGGGAGARGRGLARQSGRAPPARALSGPLGRGGPRSGRGRPRPGTRAPSRRAVLPRSSTRFAGLRDGLRASLAGGDWRGGRRARAAAAGAARRPGGRGGPVGAIGGEKARWRGTKTDAIDDPGALRPAAAGEAPGEAPSFPAPGPCPPGRLAGSGGRMWRPCWPSCSRGWGTSSRGGCAPACSGFSRSCSATGRSSCRAPCCTRSASGLRFARRTRGGRPPYPAAAAGTALSSRARSGLVRAGGHRYNPTSGSWTRRRLEAAARPPCAECAARTRR